MDAAVQPAKPVAAKDAAAVTKDPAAQFGWLPCQLSLDLPVSGFTVGNLLRLSKGSIVETASHHADDVPVRVNGLLIGWAEFEVIEDRLAIRITELA